MNQKQASKMLTVAYFLKTVATRRMYWQGSWCGGRPEDLQSFEKCGTPACALGWTAAIFPNDWEWYSDIFPVLRKPTFGDPVFDAAVYFGITDDQSELLFGGSAPNRTPKQAAKLMEQIVDSYGYCYAD